MKLKYYIISVLSLCSIYTIGQTGSSDSTHTSFSHKMSDAFVGIGFVTGRQNTGTTIIYGQSREFIIGLGTGYKFVKWNGIGIDIYYKSTGFFLAQDSLKKLPDNILHNSEKVSFDNFGGKVYDRFYIGHYFFDGGVYFDWAFYTKHITWDTHTAINNMGGTSTKSIDRQLQFDNHTNYGLTFRIGRIQGLCAYFNYRLSNLFKSGTLYPELPAYVIGLTFGIHK